MRSVGDDQPTDRHAHLHRGARLSGRPGSGQAPVQPRPPGSTQSVGRLDFYDDDRDVVAAAMGNRPIDQVLRGRLDLSLIHI